jgi:hypothetical protein
LLETEPGIFVYVTSPSKTSNAKETRGKMEKGRESSINRSLSPLDSVPKSEALLLHHFATSASKITSCHAAIQSSFCSLLLPMAHSYPPLLSALLTLSLIHRKTLFNPSVTSSHYPQSDFNDNEVMALKASSITQLRSEILLPTQRQDIRNAVLATALTLCMCEIHSGADQPRSWRLHLEGAKAILSSSQARGLPSSSPTNSDPNSQAGLLERWFTSIEALAATSSKGLRAGDLPPANLGSVGGEKGCHDGEGVEGEGEGEEVWLDDYFGFSTDLVPVFKEIGASAWERRSILDKRNRGEVPLLSEEDLLTEALALESRLTTMIRRDRETKARFYPGVRERLEEDVLREFGLCNEAYQHAALLFIYRRVMGVEREDERVQGAVRRILECVNGIEPREGLSPYIVLTMPLFTAGREVIGSDREIIRSKMRELGQHLRLKNVWRSLEILEAGWRGGTDADEGDCDFIPY